jgi:dienelactone hydrolase
VNGWPQAATDPAHPVVWAGAGHGWTMSDLPVYDEGAAELAWGRLIALLARNV